MYLLEILATNESYTLFSIILTYLECVDLILEPVDILNGDLLTCDLAFNPLEPFVQLVQVLGLRVRSPRAAALRK